MRRLLATAIAIAASAGLLVSGGSPAAAATGPIVIALEAPLSGDQSSNGRDMLRGARLAARELNAAGGVLGRRVRIVAVDDAADPARAMGAAARARKAGAVAVVGPYNSSVGQVNLPAYERARIVPMRMTSLDATSGYGATTQPMNSQIAPVESAYVLGTGAKRVAMLVDPSAYTQGMADRLGQALAAAGVAVTTVPVAEGQADYAAQVAQALASSPDLVYVSTYYPEGAAIARALAATGTPAACFLGLANVDPALVEQAGLGVAQRCRYSGVPEAAQLPDAGAYVRAYRAAFDAEPGVWGTFTYDSVRVLAAAMRRSGSTAYGRLLPAVLATRLAGATGRIAFERPSGNRVDVPVVVMRVDDSGAFVPLA